MTAKQAAQYLQIPYRRALKMLRSGHIKGKKINRRWEASESSVRRIASGRKNARAELEQRYIKLYWQGMGISQLVKLAKEELKDANYQWGKFIKETPLDFIHRTIYNHLQQLPPDPPKGEEK